MRDPPTGSRSTRRSRLLGVNLDLQALKEELPQAEADVLTAGLRTNPLLYADSQFIPLGATTPATGRSGRRSTT